MFRNRKRRPFSRFNRSQNRNQNRNQNRYQNDRYNLMSRRSPSSFMKNDKDGSRMTSAIDNINKNINDLINITKSQSSKLAEFDQHIKSNSANINSLFYKFKHTPSKPNKKQDAALVKLQKREKKEILEAERMSLNAKAELSQAKTATAKREQYQAERALEAAKKPARAGEAETFEVERAAKGPEVVDQQAVADKRSEVLRDAETFEVEGAANEPARAGEERGESEVLRDAETFEVEGEAKKPEVVDQQAVAKKPPAKKTPVAKEPAPAAKEPEVVDQASIEAEAVEAKEPPAKEPAKKTPVAKEPAPAAKKPPVANKSPVADIIKIKNDSFRDIIDAALSMVLLEHKKTGEEATKESITNIVNGLYKDFRLQKQRALLKALRVAKGADEKLTPQEKKMYKIHQVLTRHDILDTSDIKEFIVAKVRLKYRQSSGRIAAENKPKTAAEKPGAEKPGAVNRKAVNRKASMEALESEKVALKQARESDRSFRKAKNMVSEANRRVERTKNALTRADRKAELAVKKAAAAAKKAEKEMDPVKKPAADQIARGNRITAEQLKKRAEEAAVDVKAAVLAARQAELNATAAGEEARRAKEAADTAFEVVREAAKIKPNSTLTPGQRSNSPPRNLPQGWESAWDPNTQKYYYFNRSTKKQQWKHPSKSSSGKSKKTLQERKKLPLHKIEGDSSVPEYLDGGGRKTKKKKKNKLRKSKTKKNRYKKKSKKKSKRKKTKKINKTN